VDSKLNGMKVKQRHLTSLLESGNDVTLVKMEVSASEQVKKKKSQLHKFTAGLTREVWSLRDQSSGTLNHFLPAMEKYVGHHKVEKAKRKIPDLERVVQEQERVVGEPLVF
jgi:hypothetical protein